MTVSNAFTINITNDASRIENDTFRIVINGARVTLQIVVSLLP
jgi:hypothetical protein